MPAATPIYAIPYQLDSDSPDGGLLGEDMALAIEAELARIDATATDQGDDLAAVVAESATTAPIATAWTDWTTTWSSSGTQPVIGNGVIQGRYKIVGKTCWFWGQIAPGSTTTYGSGSYAFTFPPGVTAKAPSSGASTIAFGFRDNSAAQQQTGFAAYVNAASTFDGRASGTNVVGPTVPYTFATGDFIRFWGFVELP